MSDLRQDLAQAGAHAPAEPDLDRIRRRGRQLRRRRRLAQAGALSSVIALATLLAVQGDPSAERSTIVADDPTVPTPSPTDEGDVIKGNDTPRPTTAPVPVPDEVDESSNANSPDSAPTTSPSPTPMPGPEPAPLVAADRQRILTDPARDTESGPTIEPDPSLDLLALDVAYDGEDLTFIHVVEGQPTSDPPPGGTGRWHDTYFRIRGHNLVHVRAETMERDLVVVIGVIVPGARVGEHPAQRCTECTITFDGQAREVQIKIPVRFLNDVLARSDGGAIQRGEEVGGWEAHTAKTHTTRTHYEERESPHYFSETSMDSARRYDVFWTVP